MLFSKSRALRRACVGLAVVAGLGLAVVLSSSEWSRTLGDRLEERGPVDYRQAVYAGGWEMFLERPLDGVGLQPDAGRIPTACQRIRGERAVSTQYLSGIAGGARVSSGWRLYLWLMWEMWQFGARGRSLCERNADSSISIFTSCGRFCWECIG